jgi:tryptophan 2,3-dioxygenase
MSKKYSSIHYNDYLQLGKVLGSQKPRSAEFGEEAHDEMFFIIIHQVYELWFKEIIHDLTSVMRMFETDTMDEKNVGIAVARFERIIEIQKVLVAQVKVLETMTPLDFLDFRHYLSPASGFQSFQFRIVEVALGLKKKGRLTYNQTVYSSVFEEEQQKKLDDLENGNSMHDLIEAWLERTPFLKFEGFDFHEKYKIAVKSMIDREKQAINSTEFLAQDQKDIRLKMIGDSGSYFQTVLDEKHHNEQVEKGELSLSYKATMAALLINLYRDEPILRMPYLLLTKLVEIDELFTTWRYRHAQMVMRMLGRKIGTGGSSGHKYLKDTAEKHTIFLDLQNISTLMIPRSDLPELPEELKKELGFYYSSK